MILWNLAQGEVQNNCLLQVKQRDGRGIAESYKVTGNSGLKRKICRVVNIDLYPAPTLRSYVTFLIHGHVGLRPPSRETIWAALLGGPCHHYGSLLEFQNRYREEVVSVRCCTTRTCFYELLTQAITETSPLTIHTSTPTNDTERQILHCNHCNRSTPWCP